MRSAPNYKLGEAVDGVWKQELLVYLGQHLKMDTLIETGTCDGGTLAGVHHAFKEVHTIELSEYYHNISTKRFAAFPHIKLYKGNSASTLRDILKNTKPKPTLFWLDAHPSGGLTANAGDPLPDEIRAVMELRPDGFMVIDDQKDDLLIQCQHLDFTNWKREFRTGVVFLYNTKYKYQIPPFE